MKKFESNFCMSEFKLAIAILTVLLVVIIAWSTWSLRNDRQFSRHGFHLSAATTKPPAGAILVKDKMLHPYWGNCNQCHITTDAPAKSVSNVFAGTPISIKVPMPHEYWGNCNLCHQVTDGFQLAPKVNAQLAAAATTPGAPPPIAANAKLTHADWGPCSNCHQILPANGAAGNPVAFDQLSAASLGLKVQAVTAAQMQQLGLISEDGIFILAVAPGSIAEQAGLQVGDEMIRIDTIRLEKMHDFVAALALARPGKDLKVNLFRGRKSRNLFIKIPENLPQGINVVAATAPLTQNQIETQAELLGVPKTAQAVQQALAAQQNTMVAAAPIMGMGIGNATNGQMQMINTPTYQMGIGNGQMQMINTPQATAQPAHHLPAPVDIGIGNGQMQMINNHPAPAPGLVAIAVGGSSLNSPLHPQFESSPYFLLFDQAQNSYRFVGNPNFKKVAGQGVQTAQYLGDLGVQNVIAGNFTLEGFNTLGSLRITPYSGVTGTASSALAMFSNGQLQPTVQAPVAVTPQAQNTRPATPNAQKFF